MKRFIAKAFKAAAFTAWLASAGTVAAWAKDKPQEDAVSVTLLPSVTIDGDMILLGDVFTGVGKYAARPIAHAPAPGQQITLKATWLWRVANMFEVNWRPASRLDTSTVYRASIVIDQERIRSEVTEALRDNLFDVDKFEVELDSQLTNIHLATGTHATLALANLQFDMDRTRFTGNVVAPAEGPRQAIVPISGRVYHLTDVAVPNRRLKPGEIITDSDLDIIEYRVSRLDRNRLTAPESLIGLSAKRILPEGRPISHNDIQPPVLVNRNNIVTVALETPVMRLTTQAKALESGAKDEIIRVENIKSGQLVEVIVTGPNQAKVISAVQSAMR